MNHNYALIFAGGVGVRMNSKSLPKQFLEIHGKPILVSTIEQFDSHPLIDSICVLCPEGWLDYLARVVERFRLAKVDLMLAGGATAVETQRKGLDAIAASRSVPGPDDVVLVHDGVRPLVDTNTITACIEGVLEFGSAITSVSASETVVQTDAEGEIVSTIDRSACMLARAPQAFRFDDLLAAHRRAEQAAESDFVDSASLMLAAGHKLHVVEGRPENIKVTTPADFYICRALMDARENSQIFGL